MRFDKVIAGRLRAATAFLATVPFLCLIAAGQLDAAETAEKVLKTKQGDIIYLTLNVEGEPASIQGRFHDRFVPFFKTGRAGEFGALVGIDMADAPDTADLKTEITYSDGVRKRAFRVAVAAEDFREQRMTLPKDQVDPDAASLKRIALEKEKVKAVLATFTHERLWANAFIVPVEGSVTGAFGSKRILNGQPRNQHNGEDIAASLGTSVKATNDGIVKMVDDHFFSGKGVILDHGLGLFTMYFHLDTAAVKEGERVRRGDVIGTVGQSGRATGPHLHWGAWLNGSRVNPFALAKLPLGTPDGQNTPPGSKHEAGANQSTSSGTGFVISRQGHVLTNHHVIDGCATIRTLIDGRQESLSIVRSDAQNDLALLKLTVPTPNAAIFREGRSVRAGESVIVVGFPLRGLLASEANITTGTVSALAGIRNDTRFLQITAPVQPGNSGGPLLDQSGNVVGVIVAKLNAIKIAKVTGDVPQNINFAINAFTARAFLDANGANYQTASSAVKLESADIGEQAKKFTLVLECLR